MNGHAPSVIPTSSGGEGGLLPGPGVQAGDPTQVSAANPFQPALQAELNGGMDVSLMKWEWFQFNLRGLLWLLCQCLHVSNLSTCRQAR